MSWGPRWTSQEDELLCIQYAAGVSDYQIARALGRCVGGVHARRIKLRLCDVREPRRKQEESGDA